MCVQLLAVHKQSYDLALCEESNFAHAASDSIQAVRRTVHIRECQCLGFGGRQTQSRYITAAQHTMFLEL